MLYAFILVFITLRYRPKGVVFLFCKASVTIKITCPLNLYSRVLFDRSEI